MSSFLTTPKSVLKALWFRRGKIRRAVAGPYRGLRFEIGQQAYAARMHIFFRAYEPEVTATLQQLLVAPMVVFDIGAHIGIHAIYAARLLRAGGRVYAFEPWEKNYVSLQRNIALNDNQIARVVAVQKSVGKSEGPAVMVEGETDGTHHLAADTEGAGEVVAMTTIDSAVLEFGVSPDVVIVDVEGAELEVLEGGTSTIHRVHPTFLLEHHGHQKRQELSYWLTTRNYQVSDISDRHILARRK